MKIFRFFPEAKSFGEKLAKTSKNNLFPSFADFAYVLWRTITCNLLGFLHVYECKVVVDYAAKFRPSKIFRQQKIPKNK